MNDARGVVMMNRETDADCLMVGVRVVEVELARAERFHDGIEDTELTGGESTDHDATRGQTLGAELDNASLRGDAAETRHNGTGAPRAGFVHLRQQGIGGVGDDGGDDTSDDTRRQRDGDVFRARAFLGRLAHGLVDGFGGAPLDGELGHGVRHLPESDRNQSRNR